MTNRVGRGSPPLHSRWVKGQSGNPSGRRKGQRNLETVIREELARKIPGRDGKLVSMFELIARQLVVRVSKGELKWLPLLVRFAQLDGPEPTDEASPDSPDLMAEFLKTYRDMEEGK